MTEEAGARGDLPSEGRFAPLRPLIWVVWLAFLGGPLAALLRAHPAPLRLGALLVGVAIFVTVYVWAAWRNDTTRAPGAPAPTRVWRWLPLIVLTTLSVALTLGAGPRWLDLFVLTAACVGARLPMGQALRALAALLLLTAAAAWLACDGWADLVQAVGLTGVIGCIVIAQGWAIATNRALRAARAEIARLAVEAERVRFARDLHDLLGHDLARIALQSEVGEALVPTAPEQASAALREIGDTARAALRAARAAVAGYRQPTLASELRGAGELLAAAGIAYRQEGEAGAVPPATEAVLAWAVRERVTNVVKYSRARHCAIRLTRVGDQVGVEVLDDGAGVQDAARVSAPMPGQGGSGLPGLAERAAALGGHCEAGPRPGGGFRLAVMLPIDQGSGAGNAAVDRFGVPVGTGGNP